MIAERLTIPDVVLFTPQIFRDNRGFFFESFNQASFERLTGLSRQFVQDNHSHSERGVLRGLHYQLDPMAQGKLVRVVRGEVFDVAVDLRPLSTTFGHWVGAHLSAENAQQLWIPEGFAHGFFTLSETAEFLYKTTQLYSADQERSIVWNDPDLAIHWPLAGTEPVLSAKDRQAVPFRDADYFA